MAAIDDLIHQIADPDLRDRIRKEVDRMNKQKKFGLVFEEHLPECTPLFDLPVKMGSKVALKTGQVSDTYTVLKTKDGDAVCLPKAGGETVVLPVDSLVVVAEFGDPIYPCLRPIDSICNAPDSSLWHTLIEADNYHALQLLEYLYASQVDCIYIDPPYNTGARDWKYNNDYVDGNDTYRHSKWLSMMQKRLRIAKKLLNPQDSVLIVTIDEKEYLHLGCLLEEMFPEARMQMISSVINPAGVTSDAGFSRTDEYVFFVMLGSSRPQALQLGKDWRGNIKGGYKDKLRWNGLQRSGTAILRTDRPNMFYPIFIDTLGEKIVSVGKPIALETERSTVVVPEGTIAIWPIFPDGREGRWRLGKESFETLLPKHYVKLGRFNGQNTTISYLARGEQKKVENGDFPIEGYAKDGSIIVDESQYQARFVPGTQWWISNHDATQNGTKVLTSLGLNGRFSFPKSPYAVHDAIRFFTHNKPNALIIDFFAGSGTTLHAVNLLNAEDGGQRRCIMVTNNEVSDDEAKALTRQGHQPGDPEWEKLGIAHHVTWPRTVCSILGQDINGNPLKGNYIGSDLPMAEGFQANAAFYKLSFLNKTRVSLGHQFREMLPTLWMKAGAYGPCPVLDDDKTPDMLVLPSNRFAVLTAEAAFAAFKAQVNQRPDIETVFIVTDYGAGYRAMIKELNAPRTFQLYRDYLDNFRINTGRN